MYNINKDVEELVNECERELYDKFKYIDELEFNNSYKVLSAFHKYNVVESDFFESSGYGYNDVGRDKIEKIFSYVLDSEDALVRTQFISASHALSVCFFALLRPNDILLSISGKPYDTLDEVIGIKDNSSSLKNFGVKYYQIDLINDDFDYDSIKTFLNNNKVKVIEIQRSRGYSLRKALDIDKIERVTKFIKSIDSSVIIMVDNCYCEFTEDKTPTGVGCDVMVGSLIKNLGGGIANNGAYIVGNHECVELCAQRLTLAGEGRDVGPSLGANKLILQGLYHAPCAVASSLKVNLLACLCLSKLGYKMIDNIDSKRVDIVLSIIFNDRDKLIKFVQGIQEASAIDSNSAPIPGDMPGYDDQIIMASGSFVQGSSIEISCDGPLREPYVAYLQGSLTYNYGKIALLVAISKLVEEVI